MNKETESYVDMLRKFGTNLGLPQVDVEKLIETNRKNIEVLGESAKAGLPAAISRSAIRRKSSPSRLSSQRKSLTPLSRALVSRPKPRCNPPPRR